MGPEEQQKYFLDVSQLEDFAFELNRVTGRSSKYHIELEGEEWEDFQTAFDLLDKLTLRVLETEKQCDDYELYQKEVRAEYAATRGLCSGQIGGRK
ncbi:MAG: hypothetical protein VXB01_01385 [Opitutae bacterium]